MPVSLRPVKIVGCGGHGRVIADIARSAGVQVTGFIDDNPRPSVVGLPVDGPLRDVLKTFDRSYLFIIGIGDAQSRRQIARQVIDAGGELATLIHPSAVIAPDVAIGEGSVVMAGVIVNTGSKIERLCVINTGVILDHDNTIKENAQVAPGCSLAGTVTVGSDAFIGTGATIIPRIVIGKGAYVAAGATVIRDVAEHTLVAGCPAVEKKRL